MSVILIDSITATDSTKQTFHLTARDFAANTLPSLKSRGLGTGDTIRIWEYVDSDWSDTGQVLDDTTNATRSTTIASPGYYAVDAVLATAGPVSCDLNTYSQ